VKKIGCRNAFKQIDPREDLMLTNNQWKSNERRSKIRFPWRSAFRYKVLENDMIVASGNGETIDISSGGISFLQDRPLAPGAFVELAIGWPVLLDDACPMRLIVFGRVVRSNVQGTACTIERWEFRTQARGNQASALRAVIPTRTDGMLRRWADGMRKDVSKASAYSA
jgi:hypothetical protein